MNGPQELAALLAGRRGHFRMESGYHSDAWFELSRLFADPARLQPHVFALARCLARHRVAAVCGPMVGGAKLAGLIARELGVTELCAERVEPPPGDGLFRVQYRLPSTQRAAVRGKTVAIVDDAISAGSAIRGTHADLLACGAQPVALGALILFGDGIGAFAQERGLAVEAVARLPFRLWPPAACPLCAAGVAVERVSDAV